MNKKMDNKGFSLVELIIVIAIMAILVGVLAPQFIKYIESSRQSTDISAASEYKSAVEAYVAEHGEEVSGDIVVTATVNGIHANVNLADVGLSDASGTNESKFKSKGWTAGTVATYDTNTFKWSSTYGNNSKEPHKTLKAAFE